MNLQKILLFSLQTRSSILTLQFSTNSKSTIGSASRMNRLHCIVSDAYYNGRSLLWCTKETPFKTTKREKQHSMVCGRKNLTKKRLQILYYLCRTIIVYFFLTLYVLLHEANVFYIRFIQFVSVLHCSMHKQTNKQRFSSELGLWIIVKDNTISSLNQNQTDSN